MARPWRAAPERGVPADVRVDLPGGLVLVFRQDLGDKIEQLRSQRTF